MQTAIEGQMRQLIRQKAVELGFCAVGIAKADFLQQESAYLENWLRQGRQGELAYMQNHFALRTDPRQLVDGARSVISAACNYFSPGCQPAGSYKISRYAYGRDYHEVVREKLKRLFEFVRSLEPGARGRVFVDSAPVMEKAWAARSGLGWIGKNTSLISKEHGSFLFLGEIILNLELEEDAPGETAAEPAHAASMPAPPRRCLLMRSMPANAFPVLPLKTGRRFRRCLKTNGKTGSLAAISARRSVRGISRPNRTARKRFNLCRKLPRYAKPTGKT